MESRARQPRLRGWLRRVRGEYNEHAAGQAGLGRPVRGDRDGARAGPGRPERGPHRGGLPGRRRIQGDNEAGLAHRITQQWALAGISLQGLTIAAVGGKFVGYAAFDTVDDANRASQILADLGTSG